MAAAEGRSMLIRAFKDLTNKWLETKGSWNDARAIEIEEKYLVNLESDLKAVAGAMEEIGRMLSQIQRDCE